MILESCTWGRVEEEGNPQRGRRDSRSARSQTPRTFSLFYNALDDSKPHFRHQMVTHHLLRQSTRLAPSLRRLLSTGSSHRALSIKAALESTSTPEQLTINGWVRSCRRQKNISFAVINDGTNVKGIQAVLPKGLEEGCVGAGSLALEES